MGSNAPVAQLDRVLPSEGRGRRFESCRARQIRKRSREAGFLRIWGAGWLDEDLKVRTERPQQSCHARGSVLVYSARGPLTVDTVAVVFRGELP